MSPKGSTESSPLMASVSAGGFWRTNLGLFIIIGGDFCTSLSINFYNSWLMRQVPGFNFPLIYTCLHMVASFLFASLLVFGFRVAPANWEQARALVLRIVLLAFLRGASIATNNWSLMYISIALNKVIKASVPVFTVPLSILFERKRYSPYKIVALLCLASGTMLSCVSLSGQAADAKGILLALISAAVGGSSIVVGAMLMGKGTGLGPVSVLLYMSPCQVLMLASVVPFDELPPFLDFVRGHDGSTALYLAVGTLLAVAFNLMSYVQLQSTSSVTSSMLGNLKIVSIILIYEAGLRPVQKSREDHELTAINIVGYALTISAGLAYTLLSLYERGQLQGLLRRVGRGGTREVGTEGLEAPLQSADPPERKRCLGLC